MLMTSPVDSHSSVTFTDEVNCYVWKTSAAAGQRWRAEQLKSWLARVARLPPQSLNISTWGENWAAENAPLSTRRPKRAAWKNIASIAATRICTLTFHGIRSREKIVSLLVWTHLKSGDDIVSLALWWFPPVRPSLPRSTLLQYINKSFIKHYMRKEHFAKRFLEVMWLPQTNLQKQH